jgi:hypothetical protein
VRLSLAVIAVGARADTVADSRIDALTAELAALKADNDHLHTLIPSQSHAMMDVAYNFTNLWFAGQKENWPLAQFYFNESRSHIKWMIRLFPVRKTKAGEVKLQEIFEPIDSSLFADIQKQITAQDRKHFIAAYRNALAGCNGCHTASDKAFLHVIVPSQPENRIIDFQPARQ